MKNVTWPMAFMVSTVVLVLGAVAVVVAVVGGDVGGVVAAVSSSILFILIAIGIAELREIKTSTNGNTSNLMEQNKALLQELAEYRRSANMLTTQALLPPPSPPAADVPAAGSVPTQPPPR